MTRLMPHLQSGIILTFALLVGLALISAEKPRDESLTENGVATKIKQEERRGWWSDSSSDDSSSDDDDDAATDDVASKLDLISMTLHLPISMESFGEAEKKEFKRIIANMTNTLPDYVFISSVGTSADRRVLSSGIQIDFTLAVPKPKTTKVIVSLCLHNLDEAMALSSIPLFHDIEVSVVKPAVLVVPKSNDSSSDDDDDDDHHGDSEWWWIMGTTLLMIGGCCFYGRRRGWKCCSWKCCGKNRGETTEEDQAVEQEGVPAVVVNVSNDNSDPVKDQGLCYPANSSNFPNVR